MTKAVSRQITEVQQEVMTLVKNNPLPQSVSFKLGSIYANLELAKRTATEQEAAYSGIVQMHMAKNPKKVSSVLQNLADIISGNNLCEEEEINNGRTKKNLG